MRKLSAFIGATVGGWLGWYADSLISPTLAFLVGIIATGVGMDIGIRFAQRWS